MKILVTGLNSLPGWHVYLKARRRFEAFGTYRKRHARFRAPECLRVDLDAPEEIRKLLESVRPEVLVHARAICDLDLCEERPDMAREINVEGTRKLLEAARACPSLKRFVYISTDHVFSGEEGRYPESHAPAPKHVYGRTKAEAEQLVQASGLPFLIIRPGLVIGESVQGNKGPRDFLFSRIRARKPTHLFTDERRSPVCAEDLAGRILQLAVCEKTGVFHVAGPEVVDRYALGRKLALEHGLPTWYIHSRLRREDRWAHIRPKDLSLISIRKES